MSIKNWGPQKAFVPLSALLLALTALAKLGSATGQARILEFPDPLLGLSNKTVLNGVAAIELTVAVMLWLNIPLAFKHLAVAWMGGNFLIYRVALLLLRPGVPCKCLGTLTEQLHLDDQVAGYGLSVIALYFLIGGLRGLKVDSFSLDPLALSETKTLTPASVDASS